MHVTIETKESTIHRGINRYTWLLVSKDIDDGQLEHRRNDREFSFHKRSDAFNAQAYGIFATNLKDVKLPRALSNATKKRKLHPHVAHNHIFVKLFVYYAKDLRNDCSAHFVWTCLI